jgi:hypothetical protein
MRKDKQHEPSRVEADEPAHHSELPEFKMYAARIKRLVADAGPHGVTISEIHRTLGYGLQRYTIDALIWIGAYARTVGLSRYVQGQQRARQTERDGWRGTNTMLYEAPNKTYPTVHLEMT